MRVCGCLVIDTGEFRGEFQSPECREVKCLMALALGAAV
jgi:hypothetical protein